MVDSKEPLAQSFPNEMVSKPERLYPARPASNEAVLRVFSVFQTIVNKAKELDDSISVDVLTNRVKNPEYRGSYNFEGIYFEFSGVPDYWHDLFVFMAPHEEEAGWFCGQLSKKVYSSLENYESMMHVGDETAMAALVRDFLLFNIADPGAKRLVREMFQDQYPDMPAPRSPYEKYEFSQP